MTVIFDAPGLSKYFYLSQNYPNPFNPTTKIRFEVPSNIKGQKSNVVLKLYDLLGKEVARLVNQEKPAGTYEVLFDAAGLASGVYYYQLRAGDPESSSGEAFTQTKKMILLR